MAKSGTLKKTRWTRRTTRANHSVARYQLARLALLLTLGAPATQPPAARWAQEHSPIVLSTTAAATSATATSWSMDRINQSRLPLDKNTTHEGTGKGVRIYIFDEGVDPSHPELAGRVRLGYDAYPGIKGSAEHGTAVAGLAAGKTMGVAPEAEIVSVRFVVPKKHITREKALADLIGAIEWTIADITANGGPAVVNWSFSFGGDRTRHPELERAAARLRAAGVVIIESAGNISAVDACDIPSTLLPETFVVGSTGIEDGIRHFKRYTEDRKSPFSSDGKCVDIYAPGENNLAPANGKAAGKKFSGTSVAAPLVSGAAALLLEADPTLTPAQVENTLREQATPGVIRGVKINNLLLRVRSQ